jgi:head-tail adaptor
MSSSAPSRLPHRLILQAPAHVADGLGGQTLQWTQTAILWGEVQTPGRLQALEPGDAGQAVPRAQVTIRIRRRSSGLVAGHRLCWGTRCFLLQAIRDDGRSRYVELVTEEA